MFSLGDQGEPSSNKKTAVDANKASNAFFPTVKAVYDWAVGLFVTGAASSTDNAIARFDGTTGKLLQNSVVVINDVTTVTKPTLNPSPISIAATQFIDSRGTRPGLFLSAFSSDSDPNPSVYGTMSFYITPWSNAPSFAANMSYGYSGDSFTQNQFTVEAGAYDTTAGLLRYSANAGAGGTSGTWDLAVSEKSTGIGTLVTLFKLFTAKLGRIQINATKTANKGINLTETGLGVDTSAPTATLDVNGTIRLRGNTTFNGQIIDNVGSAGVDGQVLKKVGGQVVWSNP